MTQVEYVDFVRNTLQQVDKTSRFHREQVIHAINIAVNQVYYDMWNANSKTGKKSLERYTTDISKTPAVDATTGRYSIDLGVDVINLDRKTGGVFDVMTNTTTTTKFIPISVLEGNQLYGSEASLPGNIVGYSWDGARTVEFWDMSATEASAGVIVRLIQQFRSYARTDNILLPYGQDAKILELTMQFLGVIPPKDLINNNADIKQNG